MLRALLVVSLCLVTAGAAVGQVPSVLHIKVVVIDADGKATPVPRHSLLVSDDPPSAPPRLIVTAADGTATMRLRPGHYTVESDRPVSFQGRIYQWTERVEVAAGRDTTLELTGANADIEPLAASPTTSASQLESDPAFLLPQWQGSVVAIWTPTTHATGFIVDARGLIATNQRVIGSEPSVEVQLTPEIKVPARVLVSDEMRDVAVLWIDPTALASARPVPLACGQATRPSVAVGQQVFAIGAPLREPKGMTSGTVTRVERHTIGSDLRLLAGSAGGPAFAAGGGVVGITSFSTDDEGSRRRTARVVRIDDACDVVASAETKMADAMPPNGTRLPMEPVRPFPMDALKDMAQRRAGSLSPPRLVSSDFDVAFITPVLTYGAQNPPGPAGRGAGGRGPVMASTGSDLLRPIKDFSNWSEYVDDFPPVLLIRVTPKQVEGFWTTVARGAAATQGMALPSMKRFKTGFSRMRALCGDEEVTPIHPFKLEHRVNETEAIYEGLYVFDPGALGPQCVSVKLVLYSEKEPEKGDTRVVDPKVVQRIWQDFEPVRAAAAESR